MDKKINEEDCEVLKDELIHEIEYELHEENSAGKLAKGFIEHPLTLILAIFILVVGYMALNLTPREENPQIKVSGGAVIVPMPGATAAEIQKVIIEPLESKIRAIKGVENIYSIAKDSVGIIQVQYFIGLSKDESDLKLYDQVMRNMDGMPQGAMQPIIKTMDIDTDIPVATIAFYSKNENLTQTQLSTKVSKIGFEINKIDSVAVVDLKGEKKEQYNVEVELGKLSAYHLSLGQIMEAIKGLSFELPDAKGRTKDNEIVMFGIESAIESVEDLENILVASYMNSPIYLKNVATVTKSYDIQNSKSAQLYLPNQDVKEQTTLTVSKLQGANTVVINNKIFEYLDSIRDDLEKEGIGYIITRDDGYTANHAVNELVFHLLISIVIIAVLLVFTLGLKEAIIVSLTVPMILALTLFVGFMIGETINRITLFALLLSLGLLVDAAIIVIENIHRHLHSHDSRDKSLKQIAIEATNEIGNPTNIATLAIVMTFIPMFFVGGMMGQFMNPLPVFVPIALVMSLIVAYIFTPYLVNKMLKKEF
ncbi:MAG: efflux RND transporter permease subunit [Campylobacterota bacterium]|nr:efflux RND transporter permease subunit [Campylobacterota bacterium]